MSGGRGAPRGANGPAGAEKRPFRLVPHEANAVPSLPARRAGICKLCEQLELDPLEDVRVLVLLWKMGANKKPAEIQKDEWIAGCHKLKLDSIDKFRKLVPSLETGFMERDEFGDFYKVRALFSLDVYSFICG